MFNFIRNRFHPLWRLRKLPAFRWVQKHFDPDFFVRIHGTRVFVKFIRDFAIIVNYRNLEKSTRAAFGEICSTQNIDVFLDVGANVGIYSWIARKNKVSKIFMFEPDLFNCRLLLKTLIYNKTNNIFLVPFAVSDVPGVSDFHPDYSSGATGSLKNHTSNQDSLHHAYGMGEIHSVPTLNLDFLSEYCNGKNVLIKIDVEGFEGSVLSGSMTLVKQSLPVIIVECNDAKDLIPLENIGYKKKMLAENNNYLMVHEANSFLSALSMP